MIFDTHSHCYWKTLEPNLDKILEEMKEKNVVAAVQIGCDIETSFKAISLAKKYPKKFWATVGLHPETAQNEDSWRQIFAKNLWEYENNFENFLEYINSQDDMFWENIFEEIKIFREFQKMIVENPDEVVAIGECGFDFHYIDGTNDGKIPADLQNLSEKAKWQIENQKFWWLAQWKLAKKYNFPLVIHTRDARDATIDFMKKFNINRVVMHCYSEDPEMARDLLAFSDKIYFSFSGIVTYKKSLEIQETAKIIPLDRILVETDSPFLAPQIVRGSVNNPSNTIYNLAKIFELRDESPEEIEKQIFENSLRFYSVNSNFYKK